VPTEIIAPNTRAFQSFIKARFPTVLGSINVPSRGKQISTKTILRGLSSRANYKHRSTAACRPTSLDRGCQVVSMTDPYGRILGFLDRSRYFFFQVAPQLYSRDRVNPVADPLLLRKSGRAGNRTRITGSVAST
jgi:hypothetical protein